MREKGQIELAKTLETPVFSRGIEILTEKNEFRLTKANHLHGSATGKPFFDHFAPGNCGSADERAGFPRDWQFRVPRRLFLPYPAHLPKNRIDAEASPGLASSSHGTMVK